MFTLIPSSAVTPSTSTFHLRQHCPLGPCPIQLIAYLQPLVS
jgi:hypothetical protein